MAVYFVCENINSMGMYTERRAMWRCFASAGAEVLRLRKISQNAVAECCCQRIGGKGEQGLVYISICNL
jgi:predicted GNAT family acetyltransferase